MRFFWRSEDAPLTTHSAWVKRLERKNRVSGTSAPTLATAWSGPLDLFAALETHPELVDLVIHDGIVEMKPTFDDRGGNARNHDLLCMRLRPVASRSQSSSRPKPENHSVRPSRSSA
jgi:hypothetical protein